MIGAERQPTSDCRQSLQQSPRALDVDPRRLLDQAYAYGCLSAAWNADGEEEQRDLAIAAAIKQVRQTSY
ncbi:aminoglycoside phosphotransferase family protein [Pseudomonas aeruginosa]|uniref:aminoglycoside phosphotransferase family protein n=1 Tax=Pseudomonas aeruginosa TaxID=287 RepID=UPI00223884B6|nr:aminoglycoside phosphotransferase family protein [Pseudomonas aeruginosa]